MKRDICEEGERGSDIDEEGGGMREYSPLKRERCEDGEKEGVIHMRKI